MNIFNMVSEKNDAQRVLIRLKRKIALSNRLNGTFYSIANQVKRDIETVVNDGSIYLEPYFVY